MPAPIRTIGPYQVVKEIGRGGMGAVLAARGPDGREVAVKVLLDPGKQGTSERFERERRLLAALGEQEGFVPLLDGGASPAGPWIAMPFLRGGTLRERIEKRTLGLDEAIALATAISRAVGRAHDRGIVHRDLKPENVLFTDDGRPLVSDLGLAKHFRSDVDGASQSIALTKTGEFRGTATYMSPEQMVDSKSVGPPSDVFALGAIIYECVAGSPAFGGNSTMEVLARVQAAEFEPLRSVRPDAPRWLESVVAKALARAPQDRWPDAGALARALETRADVSTGSGKKIAAVAIGVVLVIALALVVALSRKKTEARREPAPAPAPVVVTDADRAAKLAADGNAEASLELWEKVLRDDERPNAEHARAAWKVAVDVADAKLDQSGSAALEVLKKLKALAPDEPREAALVRARVELAPIVAPPTGRAESTGEQTYREKRVRELLLKHRGVARGRKAWAEPLEKLSLFKITGEDASMTNISIVGRMLAQARPAMLAAQDAEPARFVPAVYTGVVARWGLAIGGILDVRAAERAFGAAVKPFDKGPDASDLDTARGLALRARVLHLRAGKDARLAAEAHDLALRAKDRLEALRSRFDEAWDDPAWLDALVRARIALGDADGALIAGERALAAFASWDTLVEMSRLRAARGELDHAADEADIAVKSIEFDTLEPGVDRGSSVVSKRRRIAVVAYKQRAAVKRLQGLETAAGDDEKRAAEAAAEADSMRLPPIEQE